MPCRPQDALKDSGLADPSRPTVPPLPLACARRFTLQRKFVYEYTPFLLRLVAPNWYLSET